MFCQKNGTGNRDSARKPADNRTSPKYNFRHVLMFLETFIFQCSASIDARP